MPPIRSREQERAHVAIRSVQGARDAKGVNFKEYQTRAQQLPSMIQNLGLGGTVAFLLAKRAADQRLADDLATWLLNKPKSGVAWPEKALEQANGRPGARLETTLSWTDAQTGDQTSWQVYRQAAHEAHLYAGWLKRWSKVDETATSPPARSEEADGEGSQIQGRDSAGSGEEDSAEEGEF